METSIAAYTVGVPRQFLTFKYDYLGRRVRKTVANWNGSAYVAAVDRKFIYDGWNLIGEYSVGSSSSTLVTSYTWGLDLSRTLQDGGGVCGLLIEKDISTGVLHLPLYDANGNLHALINRADGSITAAYEYSAFGETVRATGSYAASNAFRFSTKYTDQETQLLYYGRRYYNPTLGRWLGRDAAGESGGLHLYGFCGNNPVNRFDVLGNWGYKTFSGYADPSWVRFDKTDLWLDRANETTWSFVNPDTLGGIAPEDVDTDFSYNTWLNGGAIRGDPGGASSGGNFYDSTDAFNSELAEMDARSSALWTLLDAQTANLAKRFDVTFGPITEAVTTGSGLAPNNVAPNITEYELPNGNWARLNGPGEAPTIVHYAIDGKLNLAEANFWYRNGNGVPMIVDSTNYNISGVNPNGFNPQTGQQPYTFGFPSTNFLVNHGVLLELNPGGQTFRVVPDLYEFEMHPWSGNIMRNIDTILGNIVADPFGNRGVIYPIIFEGDLPVRPRIR